MPQEGNFTTYLRNQWFGNSTEPPFLKYARGLFVISSSEPLPWNFLIGETAFKQGLLALP